jgi:hypothetical protein
MSQGHNHLNHATWLRLDHISAEHDLHLAPESICHFGAGKCFPITLR